MGRSLPTPTIDRLFRRDTVTDESVTKSLWFK